MGNPTSPSASNQSRMYGAPHASQGSTGRRSRRAVRFILAAGLAALGWGTTAWGGTVLVARESVIHASGGPDGAGAFDLADGTHDFGRFAQDVRSDEGVGGGPGTEPPAAPAVSGAHQYSVPGVVNGTFDGAFAEGSVRADLNAAGATASAASSFDLIFRVTGTRAAYSFAASMGTVGAGVVTTDLFGVPDGAPDSQAAVPVFAERADAIAGDSKVVEEAGILQPGLYTLQFHADTSGTMDESSAYYNATLSLTPTVTAVPLPKAAWPGLGALLALAGFHGLQSRRRRTEWQQACATDSIRVLVATPARSSSFSIRPEAQEFGTPMGRRAAA